MSEPRVPGVLQGIILLLPITLAVMGIAVLVPIVPQLMTHFANVPNYQYLVQGGVLTMPALCTALCSPFAGWLSDRVGRRRLLIAAMIAYAFVGIAPIVLDDLWAIIASRVGVGICEAVVMTVSTTLISDYFKGHAREKWLASQTAVASLSALVLVAIGGLLGAHYGWRGPFGVYLFSLLLAAGVWLYYIFREGRPNLRIAQLAALAMILGPIVGALQILPAQEYGRLAWRWAGAADHLGWQDMIPYYVHIQHALHPIFLFGIFIPGFDAHAGPFLGMVAVSLAIIGVAVYWRQHAVKLFGAIAIGGLIYSLGGHSVFNGLIYALVPFVEKARVPAMATLLFHLGFAVIAAFGVDALRSQAAEL